VTIYSHILRLLIISSVDFCEYYYSYYYCSPALEGNILFWNCFFRLPIFIGFPLWIMNWVDWPTYFAAKEGNYEQLKQRKKTDVIKELYLIGTSAQRYAIKTLYSTDKESEIEFHKLMTNSRIAGGAFTIETLLQSGYTAKQLRDAGYGADELRLAGVSEKKLRQSGYTDLDLNDFSDGLLAHSNYVSMNFGQIPVTPVSTELKTSALNSYLIEDNAISAHSEGIFNTGSSIAQPASGIHVSQVSDPAVPRDLKFS